MKTILAPVDFSDASAGAVDVAAALAVGLGGKLWLLHVAAPDPDFVGYAAGPTEVREAIADALREEHRELEALAARAVETGAEVEPLMIQGPTVEAIVHKANDLDADVIVLGSHGRRALMRALLGSVSEGVLRSAGRPVLIVPARKD
jgi:nucleotide-binding universal stress UspA family protein